jgi:adenylyl-sulfate kinase
MKNRKGFTLWLTGLSGAGKTTLSEVLATELRSRGVQTEILDGDEVRTNLSKGLGFSKEDRDTNIRRIGYVCRLLSRNGVGTLSAAISPYRAIRDEVRSAIERDGAEFIEVFVKCPISVLSERDVKGLYKKALAGELKGFTGVSDPYEEPLAPDVVVETDRESVEFSVNKILLHLEHRGLVPEADLRSPRSVSRSFSGTDACAPRRKHTPRARHIGARSGRSLSLLKRLFLRRRFKIR